MAPVWLKSALTLTLAASLSGCATLFANGPSEVDITVSEPSSNATVVVRGLMNDDAVTVQAQRYLAVLDRRSPYAVAVAADGYTPQVYPVKIETNPVYWLNLMPTAVGLGAIAAAPNATGSAVMTLGYTLTLIGVLVDVLTGAATRHAIWRLDARLARASIPAPAPTATP